MQRTDSYYYHALLTALKGNLRTAEKLRGRASDWRDAWDGWRKTQTADHDPDRAWAALDAQSISLLLREDPSFPEILQEIPRAPLALYTRGNLDVLKKTGIAIVGTRKATAQGLRLAHDWAHELAQAGLAIVSGLALGIDAAAHTGALDAGGPTIAVLGNGIDSIYPKTNERLGKRILAEGGLIISEYPPQSPSLPAYFLERNRIVAGLARGTLIVEAPARSGTLATARAATEAGRDVWVVPGTVSHPNFQGSHALIREGAELVRNANDILESLGMADTTAPREMQLEDPNERALADILRRNTAAVGMDTLIEESGLSAAEVNSALAFLIMKGMIIELGQGYALKQ